MNYEIGEQIGDMTVVGAIVVDDKRGDKTCKSSRVLCKCSICGREKVFQKSTLQRGVGVEHRMCNHDVTENIRKEYPEFYRCWNHIKARINNPNIEHYDRYGGRGLTNDYEYFVDFCTDLFDGYLEHISVHGKENTTVERINNDLGYVRGNVRWATWKEQAVNRCTTIEWKIYDPYGNLYTTNNLKEFCNLNKLNYVSVTSAVRRNQIGYRGWKFKKAQ